MTRWLARSSLVLISVCLFGFGTAPAWEVDGSLICYQAQSQIYPVIVADGFGGAIVAWEDSRDGPGLDIYVQRVDGQGHPLWTVNGVAACTATGDQAGIALVADGTGGAFVAWADHRGDNWNIHAQRFSGVGTAAWIADGVTVCDADYDQRYPLMIADGAGGVIVAWTDQRGVADELSNDIYAQRLDGGGVPQWTADGVAVVSETGAQSYPAIIPDGGGGAFLAWDDWRNHVQFGDIYGDVFAAHLTSSGVRSWELELLSYVGHQGGARLVAGPEGGGLVVWNDGRDETQGDIYGSGFTAAGAPTQNPLTGRSLVGGDDSEILTGAVSDGAGGVIVFWADDTSGDYDIAAQRFDGDLEPQWTVGGITVCDAPDLQASLRVVGDGFGGALVTWEDRRDGSQEDIMAQRLDADGTALWNTNGLAVCANDQRQLMPAICGDGEGGAILAWHDRRLGTPGDIWGHAVAPGGDLVPIDVPRFSSAWVAGAIEVRWRMVGDSWPHDWAVERATWPDGPFTAQPDLEIIPAGDAWLIRDRDVAGGLAYRHRVRRDGQVLLVTEPVRVPIAMSVLLPPRPNPCNPRAQVRFTLSAAGGVDLGIFDLGGRRLATLASGSHTAGSHGVAWGGCDGAGRPLPTGTYVVQLVTADRRLAQKLQLVR